MQFINRYVPGRQDVGHIDLMPTFSFIEVPSGDARKVVGALNGAFYHNKKVSCHIDRDGGKSGGKGGRRGNGASQKGSRGGKREQQFDERKAIFDMANMEEGWARRKPKKKKK